MKRRLSILVVLLFVVLANAPRALACAACYGKSDSALAQGMNWGIFALLGVIGVVLIGIASFFIFLVRRAATVAAVSGATPVSSTKV